MENLRTESYTKPTSLHGPQIRDPLEVQFGIVYIVEGGSLAMGKALSAVIEDALNLPPVERALLLEEIYRSLETEETERSTRAWAEEAESRIDAYDRGEMTARAYSEIQESLDK